MKPCCSEFLAEQLGGFRFLKVLTVEGAREGGMRWAVVQAINAVSKSKRQGFELFIAFFASTSSMPLMMPGMLL